MPLHAESFQWDTLRNDNIDTIENKILACKAMLNLNQISETSGTQILLNLRLIENMECINRIYSHLIETIDHYRMRGNKQVISHSIWLSLKRTSDAWLSIAPKKIEVNLQHSYHTTFANYFTKYMSAQIVEGFDHLMNYLHVNGVQPTKKTLQSLDRKLRTTTILSIADQNMRISVEWLLNLIGNINRLSDDIVVWHKSLTELEMNSDGPKMDEFYLNHEI